MFGRKPRNPLRLGALATGVFTVALSCVGSDVPSARGQEPLPKLPATKVEGTPTPGTPTQPAPDLPFPPTDPGPATGPGVPVSGGGIFASPAADGYRAGSSTTATGFDVPQLNIPATVNIVPSTVIRDQQALRVDDILRDISAAGKLGDVRRSDSLFLRGFEVDGRDYRRNGFRDPSETPRDFANIQRVEVLKGPASILYGSGQPAGVINFITKKPLPDFYENYNVQFGSFDLIRPNVDASAPLDEEGRYLLRVTSAYENTNGFRDFYFNERSFVCPSFTWMISEDTSFNIEYEYLNDRRRFDTGVVAPGNIVGLVPINTYLGEPGDFIRFQDQRLTLNLVHRFDEDTYLRVGAYGLWNQNSFADTSTGFFGGFPSTFGPLEPLIIGVAPNTVIRDREETPEFNVDYYSVIADFAFAVQTGPFEHKFLVGTELGWYNSTFVGSASAVFNSIPLGPFSLLSPLAPIDPFNPVYGGTPPPLVNNPALVSVIRQDLYGFYAQDLIDLNERWQLLMGVRYDIVHNRFTRSSNFALDTNVTGGPSFLPNLGFPEVTTDTDTYRLSPRVGLVYQPIPQVLALYASYSQSFDALTGTFSRSPEPLLPEIGESWEGGFKTDLLDGQLSFSMAGWYITRQNVAVLDQSTLTTTQVGVQRSQGMETTLVGRITDRWSVIGNYAYVDSRITEDDIPSRVGKPFRNVPYNTANLWSRFDLLSDDVQTFGIAAGLVFVDHRAGDLDASFTLPGYTRWDGGLYYRRNSLYANLYLENLFDRQYYTGSVNNVQIFPGAPFTARATVGVEF